MVALLATRRLSRRLDALNQAYWELRYDYTRLRSRVTHLDQDAEEIPGQDVPPAPPAVAFVPLSTIRKKDR